jgi:hypothetical protein
MNTQKQKDIDLEKALVEVKKYSPKFEIEPNSKPDFLL